VSNVKDSVNSKQIIISDNSYKLISLNGLWLFIFNTLNTFSLKVHAFLNPIYLPAPLKKI